MKVRVQKAAAVVASGLATLSVALVLAQGNLNPIARPRISPQIQPGKVNSAYSYTKKQLTFSTVDFLSSATNPSYTNTGEAVITFSADDVVSLPPELTPELTVYATSYPTPFKLRPLSPELALAGTALYEYDTGTAQQVEGSRVYARYDKGMQTIRLKLMQTYYQIDSKSTSGNRGVSSDIFCIHVNFIDDQKKVWYYGKAVVRLFMSGREEVRRG